MSSRTNRWVMRSLALFLLLAGCSSVPLAPVHRASIGFGPRLGTAVDSMHVGNYHCASSDLLAWVGPDGEVRLEADGIRLRKNLGGIIPFYDALAGYEGTLADSLLPLVVNNVPDTIGHATGSASVRAVIAHDSTEVDTLWVTYRLGITGGPWPAQSQIIEQWLAFDSTYAGMTP